MGIGGTGPTVSPAGFTMGGGYSLISRTFGLGADNVLEIQVFFSMYRTINIITQRIHDVASTFMRHCLSVACPLGNIHPVWNIMLEQDRIFRCKRLSTGASFVHVYSEIWDKGILKLNKFSM